MKIEVSVGEIVDKVSILEIKLDKVLASDKLANIRQEYSLLKADMESLGITTASSDFVELKKVNLEIWNIEDAIRLRELHQDFGGEFIQLARDVYFKNDRRASIKRKINYKYGSLIIEEKEYTDYGQDK